VRLLHRLEPLWWLLFGAGGFAAALVLPALFFTVAIAFPFGWFGDPVATFHRMQTLCANPLGQGLVSAVLSLTFWHSAHHLRHFALEFGLQRMEGPLSWALYALAGLASVITLSVVFSV
jgi:fumarate reductase subunit D